MLAGGWALAERAGAGFTGEELEEDAGRATIEPVAALPASGRSLHEQRHRSSLRRVGGTMPRRGAALSAGSPAGSDRTARAAPGRSFRKPTPLPGSSDSPRQGAWRGSVATLPARVSFSVRLLIPSGSGSVGMRRRLWSAQATTTTANTRAAASSANQCFLRDQLCLITARC
jgi:hypothetical protein